MRGNKNMDEITRRETRVREKQQLELGGLMLAGGASLIVGKEG